MISVAEMKKIRTLEVKAFDFYERILSGITNERIVEIIREIRDDEARHIQIAERLVAIVEAAAAKSKPAF